MRISSIDFFRSAAIFAVIILHTSPFRDSHNVSYEALYIGITNAARFAIPYFFIVAGYFFGKKIRSGTLPGELLKVYTERLLPLFLLWSSIYLILPTNIKKQVVTSGLWQATYQKVYSIIADPITLVFQGGRGHLWFLISLLMALGIMTLVLKLNRERCIIPIAALLYFFGLIAGSYSATPIGISISFNTVEGPFFSTLLVAIGWSLSSEKYNITPIYALILATIGMTLHMAEFFFLWKFYHISPTGHGYFLGTLLWSTGLTMFALSQPRLFDGNMITKWGSYTLGIYLLHLLVLDMFTPFNKIIPFPLWDVIYPFIVYFLSVMIVSIFSKNRWLKYLVVYK